MIDVRTIMHYDELSSAKLFIYDYALNGTRQSRTWVSPTMNDYLILSYFRSKLLY